MEAVVTAVMCESIIQRGKCSFVGDSRSTQGMARLVGSGEFGLVHFR